MSKAHDSHACTCPSGDGSLRWPCPVHPPVAKCDCLDECGSDPAVQSGTISPCSRLVAERLAQPDNNAVAGLAKAMRDKLEKQRAKGYGGWDKPECSQQRLSDMLREHVAKGDPVDVANFCAFLHTRGEGIASSALEAPAAPDANRLRAEILEHASKGSRLVRTLFNEPTDTLSDVEVGDWIQRAQHYLTLPSQTAPAAVAVPEFDEWITREYPHLGPIGEGVNIAREAWHAGRAARAANSEIPATEDSSAGDLAEAPASRLTLEQAEAMAFCSTNEPTSLLRYWFRKGYTAAADLAEVQAESVAWPELQRETVTKLLELARIVDRAVDDWGESFEDGSSNVIFHKEEANARDATLDYLDSLPENPDPMILESGPLKAARLLSAPQAKPADALEPVRQAVRDYHYALDTRQHGGVAADAAISAIERALGMRWLQGQEAGRRNAVAPAQSKGE